MEIQRKGVCTPPLAREPACHQAHPPAAVKVSTRGPATHGLI